MGPFYSRKTITWKVDTGVESKPESADRLQNLIGLYRSGDRWQEAERRAFLRKAREEGLELEGAKSLVDEILSPGHPQEESVRATLLSKSLLQALAVLQMKDRGRFEATLGALRASRGTVRLVEGLERSVNSERRASVWIA